MKLFLPPLTREQGFALITTLLILLVLTVLGILATNNTTIELRIAGNDRVHKQTFYQADGGTELIERLLYENSICSEVKSGFTNSGMDEPILNRIVVLMKDFASQSEADPAAVSDATARVAYFPDGTIAAGAPHTNFLSSFVKVENPGSQNEQVAGTGGGGPPPGSSFHRRYTSGTQHSGVVNSQTTLVTQWRIDGTLFSSPAPTDCKY